MAIKEALIQEKKRGLDQGYITRDYVLKIWPIRFGLDYGIQERGVKEHSKVSDLSNWERYTFYECL